MLDFGWSELILIMALAVLVIGPKELPAMMLGLGRLVRRLQYVKYAFSQQFDEFMHNADMENMRKSVNFEEGDARFEDAEDDEVMANLSESAPKSGQSQNENGANGKTEGAE